jgi:tetratricopeptide (TPR) repeat protein
MSNRNMPLICQAGCLAVLAAAGCVSVQPAGHEPEPAPAAQPAPAVIAVPRHTAAPGDVDMTMWGDPEFQRRLAQSYISETDIEPHTADDVREKMQGVMKLLSEGQVEEKAADKLAEDGKADEAAAHRATADAKANEAAALLEKYRKEPIVHPVEKVEEKKKSLVATIIEYADRRAPPAKVQQEKPKTVGDEPATALYDFTLGNIRYGQKRLDEAAEAYQEAAHKFPNFRRAWEMLSSVYAMQKQYDEALVALNHVLELGGNRLTTYRLMAFCNAAVGNSMSAESAFRMAILLDPASMELQQGLARSLLRQGRYADVVALTTRLIAEHPEQADLWTLQTNAYLGLGQPTKAAQNYEMLDRLGQATYENLCLLGDIYVNDEAFDVAASAYLRAIDKNPEGKPDRAIRAAKVMASRGAMAQAKILVERVESLKSTQIDKTDQKELLWLHVRIVVSEGGGAEEAKVLEQIVALAPLDGAALLQLGQYYNRNKDLDKAIVYYDRASELEPFKPDALVRKAQVLVERKKYAEAMTLLENAQQIKYRENVQTYIDQLKRIIGRGPTSS